jgi:hypothetical protein
MSQEKDAYLARLDQSSSVSRHDPLRDAVREFLAAWDAADAYEKEDLDENVWGTIRQLRETLEEVKR